MVFICETEEYYSHTDKLQCDVDPKVKNRPVRCNRYVAHIIWNPPNSFYCNFVFLYLQVTVLKFLMLLYMQISKEAQDSLARPTHKQKRQNL